MMSMTTKEVSEQLGIKVPTLQKWVREGLLDPVTEGEGNQKRIIWDDADVAEAAELLERGGRSSATELLNEVAPSGIVPHLIKARAMRETLPAGKVVVVSERGMRAFDHDTPIGLAMRKVDPDNGGMLLLVK